MTRKVHLTQGLRRKGLHKYVDIYQVFNLNIPIVNQNSLGLDGKKSFQ